METPLITFRCPPALLEQLEREARRRGISRSDALRLAIIQFTTSTEGDK